MQLKTVCIIGRPNTGKSSLFNILIREKKSIIMDNPGVTRDRIYGIVNYKNKRFSLIDTGGLEKGKDKFQENILLQATYAIDEADLILFLIDGKEELNQSDFMIRDMLKKSQKEVIVVVNKLDNKERDVNIYRYYELGFAKIIPISAAHKKGINELLEEITKEFKEESIEEEQQPCRFSVIGRPNVGKSSLINAILKEERAIVSDIAGTTRDATDSEFTYYGEKYICVDTAGIRKQGKIYENIEKYSYLRSMKAIENSDVCVLVIDASQKIMEMDKHIAGMAIELGKAIIICVNKWDLVNASQSKKEWEEKIKYEFQFIPYAKVVFLSALTKKRIQTLMPEIISSFHNYQKYILTSQLNQVIQDSTAIHAAPSYKGKRLKIFFVNQESSSPPKFIFYVNDKNLVHFSYERYLENQLRKSFDLTGTPIIMKFKNRSES